MASLVNEEKSIRPAYTFGAIRRAPMTGSSQMRV